MSDLRKKGDVPVTPKDRHTMNIGTGNYNHFAPLQPPPMGRSRNNSKRKYDDDTPTLEPKSPRLDANLVFSQLKASDEAVSEIRKTLDEAVKVGESCYSATDGGIGEAFFKLAKTVDLRYVTRRRYSQLWWTLWASWISRLPLLLQEEVRIPLLPLRLSTFPNLPLPILRSRGLGRPSPRRSGL